MVKRYQFGQPSYGARPSDLLNGMSQYVLASDYDALVAEMAEHKAEHTMSDNANVLLHDRIRSLEAALRYWLPEEVDGMSFAASEYERWQHDRALLTSQETVFESPWVITKKQAIEPTHEAADAFWKYWRENGDMHKHGYYESTWGAINAALNASAPKTKANP